MTIKLTPRENEIVAALLKAATNAEIALALGISPQTIKTIMTRIFDKVGVRTRLQLALWAYKRMAR